jgi:peroxiredoxin
MKIIKTMVLGNLLLFLLMGILYLSPWWPLRPNNLLTGYTLNTSNGTALDLGTLQGKTVVINFWAPWCPPCVEEMPALNALYPELQAKQVELLGIAVDTADNVHEFLTEHNVDYPILIAQHEGIELATKLGNTQGGLPYTVILSTDGKQILTKAGRIHPDEIKKALLH